MPFLDAKLLSTNARMETVANKSKRFNLVWIEHGQHGEKFVLAYPSGKTKIEARLPKGLLIRVNEQKRRTGGETLGEAVVLAHSDGSRILVKLPSCEILGTPEKHTTLIGFMALNLHKSILDAHRLAQDQKNRKLERKQAERYKRNLSLSKS